MAQMDLVFGDVSWFSESASVESLGWFKVVASAGGEQDSLLGDDICPALTRMRRLMVRYDHIGHSHCHRKATFDHLCLVLECPALVCWSDSLVLPYLSHVNEV